MVPRKNPVRRKLCKNNQANRILALLKDLDKKMTAATAENVYTKNSPLLQEDEEAIDVPT